MTRSYINLTRRQFLFLQKLIKERIIKLNNRNDYYVAKSLQKKLPHLIELIGNYVYLKGNIEIKGVKKRKSGTLYIRI